MVFENLKKNDSLIIKGVGISLIVLHNLLHNIKTAPSQNEFNFSIEKTYSLISILYNDIYDLPRALISYFGHYGVQLFIFISAYGLTVKYYNKSQSFNAIFLRSYFKLLFPFLYVLLFLIIYKIAFQHLSMHEVYKTYGISVLLKVFGINIPGYSLSPVGPWWFIPMIIQFYLIFPLILFFIQKYKNTFLITLTIISLTLSIYFNKKIIFFNVIGHIPVFCLGVFFATNKIKLSTINIGFVFIIFILAQFNPYLWFLSPSSFVLLFLSLYQKSNLKLKYFKYIGAVSIFMFLINGFLREPFITIIKQSSSNFLILSIAALYLLYVFILAYTLNLSYMQIKRLFR
jgi:peptidoglycan/LPS O-acetylase OafA/YrhL